MENWIDFANRLGIKTTEIEKKYVRLSDVPFVVVDQITLLSAVRFLTCRSTQGRTSAAQIVCKPSVESWSSFKVEATVRNLRFRL